ncbi:MAG: AAA family ATPase, partial [Thermoleophilia bacterium]|nr:AAA family ATPase [Thermoleophilia bacterium]
TGDAVNVAARLEQAATPGEILIGAETLSLVRDAVTVEPVEPLELKGKREPVSAFRLVTVDATAPAFTRHLNAPLVGRVREQQRLRGAFEDARSERVCHMFTLLGPAGVGKSRLTDEFLASVGEAADILRSRCLHYGEDITYWPLVEILLAIGVEPGDVTGDSPADTQLAFRKLIEGRAATRPQILVLDDIQWAEPVFLDLIEHIADWSRDAPILLLCIARPELLELRPGWGGGKLNATTILLEALSVADCELLISRLAGGAQLTDDVRARILQAADGNPLFIEEMLATVSEDGSKGEIVVPPTIQALLQSRLDRLGPGERDMIGRGAVEGQVFHRSTVQELAPAAERADVASHLLSLVRKEMIRPDQPTYPNEEAFRFRHLLIRDAAYDSLPKETRAELHEAFAGWLDQTANLVEQDEIVGYHLERAHRNRAELDSADPRLEVIARRAAARLEAAARGAKARGDFRAVSGLLERAATLLPVGDSQRLELLIGLADPLNTGVRSDRAHAIAAELTASREERFQAFAVMVDLWASAWAGEYVVEDAAARVEAAEKVFRALGDELGMAWVERDRWYRHWIALHVEASCEAAARGEAHARAAGDDLLANDLRRRAQAGLVYGPAHVDDALPAAQERLGEETGSLGRAVARRRISTLLAMRSEFEAARASIYASVDGLGEAGLLIEAAAGAMHSSFVETRAGALETAERELRAGVAELERLGGFSYYTTAALTLADVLASRGAYEEAGHWCAVVRERMVEGDLVDAIAVNAIEGFLAAASGAHPEGERLTRHAVEIASTIDMYDAKARAYEWRARTLALVGKLGEAREAAATALAIYEAKGDIPASAWARDLRDSLST